MRILTVLACAVLFTSVCGATPEKDIAAQIISLERGALDRWGKGDPGGYQEIYAPEVTYFDPMQDKRIDGLDAIKAMQAPIEGKVRVDRYDMIDPKVQHYGDIAVLTFNLLSYRTGVDGKEAVVGRWNSTEVYRATVGTWKIIHVHWSYLKPELKRAVSETRRD
ncbi:MAG: YybH family protein [Bryobacteraceae bacterium]